MRVVLPLPGRPTMPSTTGWCRTGLAAVARAPAARLVPILGGVDVEERSGRLEGDRRDSDLREEVEDAAGAGGEQSLHVRQAPGTVRGVQRLKVIPSHGQGDIDVGEGREDLLDGVAFGKGDVGGQGEDGLAKAGEDRRQARQRRAGHEVGDHLDVLRQVRRRLARVSHRDPDGGKDTLQERYVACEQGHSGEAQPPLVAAHAPRLSSGEDYADADGSCSFLGAFHDDAECSSVHA